MFCLKIPICPEGWDETKEEFVQEKTVTLQMEHSLVSLSKWEAKWNKPFLSNPNMTDEESIDYIKCMTVTKNVDPEVYNHLTKKNVDEIIAYINAPMTATTFNDKNEKKSKKEIVTSELLYYLMVAYNIPFECQKWHLNRLMTLIRICDIKNNPPKKKSKGEIMRNNATINAARRAKMHSRG